MEFDGDAKDMRGATVESLSFLQRRADHALIINPFTRGSKCTCLHRPIGNPIFRLRRQNLTLRSWKTALGGKNVLEQSPPITIVDLSLTGQF